MSNIIKSPLVKSGQKVVLNNRGIQEIVQSENNNNIDNDSGQLKVREEELLNEAKKESENIMEQARIQAEEILRQAKEEAASAKNEGQKEIRSAIDQGHEEGYLQGLEAGKEEGSEQVLKQINNLLTNLNQEVINFNHRLEERIPQLKEDIIRIAISISKKIIGRELKTDSQLLKDIIQKIIKLLDGEEEIKVRVSPEDLELLGAYKEELISANNGIEVIKVIRDENIKNGGCIIETDFGGFDATIDSQLKEVEASLLEVSNNE